MVLIRAVGAESRVDLPFKFLKLLSFILNMREANLFLTM
jgi:hypothetical protein